VRYKATSLPNDLMSWARLTFDFCPLFPRIRGVVRIYGILTAGMAERVDPPSLLRESLNCLVHLPYCPSHVAHLALGREGRCLACWRRSLISCSQSLRSRLTGKDGSSDETCQIVSGLLRLAGC
jgi:hypothetical protein